MGILHQQFIVPFNVAQIKQPIIGRQTSLEISNYCIVSLLFIIDKTSLK